MLQVSIPIAHELLAQCIKQGQALVQRATLVGDFSDYESWKAARKQWVDPTVQALEHMYGGQEQAREFTDAVTPSRARPRWQEQYGTDVDCVKAAIEQLTLLQSDLAFVSAPISVEQAQEALADAPPSRQQAHESMPDAPRETPQERETLAEEPFAAPQQQRVTSEEQSLRLADEASAQEPESSTGAELAPSIRVGAPLAGNRHEELGVERASAPGQAPALTRQIIVAHGRNEQWKQAVAHLLEQAGSHDITILNDRPDEHGALVEQFGEHEPGSRYAVVLLTADDVGAPRLQSEAEPYFSPRARQGVVFEMGFLVAALTPGCVCVLYEDGVELPCDLEGISYVRLDLAGTWQPKLLLHLRKAGFDYDLNKLVSV